MAIALEHNETTCVIHLEGEVNISSAAQLKNLLLKALSSGTEVRLDIEKATELDVAALQLLWSAEREARGSGVGFTLVGRVPDEIKVALGDAGFEKLPIPEQVR